MYSLSASLANDLKMRSKTPLFAHRLKRWYTMFQSPKRAGKSRQGLPFDICKEPHQRTAGCLLHCRPHDDLGPSAASSFGSSCGAAIIRGLGNLRVHGDQISLVLEADAQFRQLTRESCV